MPWRNRTALSCALMVTSIACGDSVSVDVGINNLAQTHTRDVGDLTCQELHDCIIGCPTNDEICVIGCHESATVQAETEHTAMYDCLDAECGSFEGDAWQTCAQTQCIEQLALCFPPDNCNILGGDCPIGAACYPTPTGDFGCRGTAGASRGSPCTEGVPLACADGTICFGDGTEDVCSAYCYTASDCDESEFCALPLFGGIDDLGVCLEGTPMDADNDGHFTPDDCDDYNSAVYPNAVETCNDTLDNNCNDIVNEGCAVPSVTSDAAPADGGCSAIPAPTSLDDLVPGMVSGMVIVLRRRRQRFHAQICAY